eukprot:CAMPEP_0185166538 /NCGR_PEP_ID=MMETSP1139-20130426/12793_1 /TAXON_ID=298111 /ORGANISM="Pavlova sp., Strain CCMP459" /LENGTH=102 /DNA_ID=CAMNT_0027731989 /DNA_START=144 /DNA_END=452 /DNA_ORIENTATION=+
MALARVGSAGPGAPRGPRTSGARLIAWSRSARHQGAAGSAAHPLYGVGLGSWSCVNSCGGRWSSLLAQALRAAVVTGARACAMPVSSLVLRGEHRPSFTVAH